MTTNNSPSKQPKELLNSVHSKKRSNAYSSNNASNNNVCNYNVGSMQVHNKLASQVYGAIAPPPLSLAVDGP